MVFLFSSLFLASIFIANRWASRFPLILRRPIQWLRSLLLELLVWFSFIPLRIFSFFSSHKPLGSELEKRPILLVHGYLNADFVWLFFKYALAKNKIGPIYTINLGSPFSSIRYFAEKVKKKAAQIAKETGRTDLTLIGHSMGGLVSTYYTLHFAPKNSVKQVITIGSPLKGTYMAKIGLGTCAREMEIGSPLVQELQQAEQRCPSVSFFNLATKTDALVIPYYSSFFVSDPNRTHLFEDIGHVTLLFSPRTVEKVSDWLLQKP